MRSAVNLKRALNCSTLFKKGARCGKQWRHAFCRLAFQHERRSGGLRRWRKPGIWSWSWSWIWSCEKSASLCQTDGGGAGGGEGGDGSRPQRKELNAGRRVVAIPWSIWSRWVGVGEEELVATTIITITNNFFVNPVVASMVILDMMTRGASLLEEDTLKSIERSDSQYHVKSANQFFLDILYNYSVYGRTTIF